MEVNSNNEAEIALINLAFAEAELVAAGISSKAVDRALEHIREAQASLKKVIVNFDEAPGNDESQDNRSKQLGTRL